MHSSSIRSYAALVLVLSQSSLCLGSSLRGRALKHSAVCTPAKDASAWLFDTPQHASPSCISSAGGANDLGTAPKMCDGDPTSIRIETTPGKAECLVAVAPQCKIPMRQFASLDYDFALQAGQF